MKIQYRHQKFQADAAKAVVDVFAGQPHLTPTYMIDKGITNKYVDQSEEIQIARMDLPDLATRGLYRSFLTGKYWSS